MFWCSSSSIPIALGGVVIMMASCCAAMDAATAPDPVPFANLRMDGELKARLSRNFDRLETPLYQPLKAFGDTREDEAWPGDKIGRTLLGLVLDAQATQREPQYLDAIFARMPEHLNAAGYFGPVYPKGVVNEQQLSSHGWVLRALCEHYLWKHEPRTLQALNTVIDALVLPTQGMHCHYPIDPSQRSHGGEFSGSTAGQIGGWMLSTDIGCDLIFMDGVAQAYEVTGRKELLPLLDEMAGIFEKLDLKAIQAQTHASLSGMRAMLRLYQAVKKPELLRAVEERFALYKRTAMTENGENYNWFVRPKWTEPCAVVDSYLVALWLWRFTANPVYLEDAQHIYYNGLGFEQRANGGFGLSNCSGTKTPYLNVRCDEAYWCCTMRGAEGLARAAQFAFCTTADAVYLTDFRNAGVKLDFSNGALRLTEETGYPFEGTVRLRVEECSLAGELTLGFFMPRWAENPSVTFNGVQTGATVSNGFVTVRKQLRKGDVIECEFELKRGSLPPSNENSLPGYSKFHSGPLLLGHKGESEVFLPADAKVVHGKGSAFEANGIELVPVYHLMAPEVKAKPVYQIQVLFAPGKAR